MSVEPRVSVIMPVLDPHPGWFRESLASVLGQTLQPIEVIVVEDPGSRSAKEVVARIADPRIRYIVNPQRTSLVKQRNRGIAEARAELVASQDADDIAAPDRLETQRAFLASHPNIDVVGAQLEVIDVDGNSMGYRRYPQEHDAIVRAMRRFNPIAQPAVMFRRNVVVAAGGYEYDEHPAEDYELWSRLASRGSRFANLPEPLLRYRIHGEASKRKRLHAMIRGTLAIKKRYWLGSMTAGDKARMGLEYLLLGLPPAIVLDLFLRISVSRQP